MPDLVIDGKGFDFDDLTLGELEQIEDELGATWTDLSGVKKTIGAIWQLVKRDNPDYTLDEARSVNAASIFEDSAPSQESPDKAGTH